jgi:tetratricopeptide (TPR) repeat protein
MQLQTIRTALAELQSDPEQTGAWHSLDEALTNGSGDRDEMLRLLVSARQEHLRRREWQAVARLLEAEAKLTLGTERELERLRLEAKILRENLLEEVAACRLYERILELAPRDPEASIALEESRTKRDSWRDLVTTYLTEADKAPDDLYRSSMSMRAAEVELRFAGDELDRERVQARLAKALALDARNERAAEILELLHRGEQNYEAVARVLETLLEGGETLATRVAAGVRAGRVAHLRLKDDTRAARFYRRVLALAPTHPEALTFLSEHYAAEERWDDLVEVYETSLAGDAGGRERLGDILQVGMLLWKKRKDPASAEPWFARVRKLDPANLGMLGFYRELYASDEAAPQLLNVLTAAQRVLPSGKEKQAVTAEIAHLAAGHKDAQKAVEQYKNLLRQDPSNEQALVALRQLYRKTQNYAALVELLRQQLEGLKAEQTEERLSILREVAALYRNDIASDTALVSVLNQIAQLDPNDVEVARELVVLYERLGRWRDLLTSQQRLATLTNDRQERIDLMRSAGRRWLDQFSNVQNATQAFESLLEAAPGDREASDRLRELYKKRRAWASLYKLYEADLPRTEGAERQELLQEMARLASERLGRGDDAARIYRQILEGEPSNSQALASLERQAERSKDWATLAEALERRADQTDGAQQKMVVLQKLGSVYADHLNDQAAAARTFLRVLELSPGHARALRVLRDGYLKSGDFDGLEALYASQNDWEGLAEVLSNAADRAEDPRAKVDLSYRAARVYAEKLAQPARAFRSYERILAADPRDLGAARALIPIYEAEEKWARLPALYELCLAAEDDPDVKSAWLQKLIELTGNRLVDRARALSYARAAFELAPEQPEALTQLEEASGLARDWGPFVDAVSSQLSQLSQLAPAPAAAPVGSRAEEPEAGEDPAKKRRNRRRRKRKDAVDDLRDVSLAPEATSLADPVVRRLELKLARVYDEHLGRTDDAVALLGGIVARDPNDTEALQLLESLLRREGRRDELRQLLEVKLGQASDREARISMLSDWANLEQTEFDSRDRAAELYRRILEVEPGRLSAVRALPQLLLSLQKPEEAARAIEEQRVHVEGPARADLEVQLAELYLEDLGQPQAALAAAARTLEHSPHDTRAMLVLRRLVDVPETRRKAAEVLAQSYSEANDARREAEALESALEAVNEPEERRRLLLRLAAVHETKLESFGAAFDVLLKAIREFPDDLSLWDRAEALASASGRLTELSHALRDALRADLSEAVEVELCDRAARLHEDVLGDPIGAAPYLERLLNRDPSNQGAFTRLKQILTSAERWGELEDLYSRTTKAIEDVPTRVDLLTEVALVCEEIIEDDAKAIGYYERIFEIAPGHESSMRALDRLYLRSARYREWADLLELRLLDMTGDEALDTELRLARVELEQLHEPGKAIEHVEHVLAERLFDYTARELCESILEIGSYRVRAARALEAVYESRDEVRELVNVLEIRWAAPAEEAADGTDTRRELLRRIAQLKDERLHDDVGALEAFARYVPEDPLDVSARERFVEIGSRRGEFARVAQVLEQAAEAAPSSTAKGEILMQAASIHHDHLADLERAEALYRRVLTLEPQDAALTLPAARALERLYEASAQYAELADILRIEIRLETAPDVRASLLGRLGELSEKRLRDPNAAIEAFKSRLDELPDDELALEALDRLYEATENWRELVSVLERRREARAVGTDRQSSMRRQAIVLSSKLGDAAAATDVWRAYRAEFGDSEEALSALEALYRAGERWEDLADTYEAHLETASDPADKLRMLTALGDLRGERLGLPQPALDAYREALEIDFAYRPARLALERLLESDDALTQREAAEVLEPVFQTEGDHQRLLKVIEIQAESAEDPIRKIGLLEKAADIAENVLDSPERTLTYVTRALREGAGHVDLTSWLERLERVAATTSRRQEQVALLREIVGSIFDGQVQFDVTQRIAELSRDHLGDAGLAREYFEKALELRPDARAPMEALEVIYEQAGDTQSLLGILERRADATPEDGERKRLLLRRAELLRDRLQDPALATEAFEAILDLGPDARAADALEGLYASAGRFEDLIDLYQRQLDSGSAGALGLRVKIARVAARELGDLPRAFEALEAALAGDRHNGPAVAELEHLMQHAERPEHRAQAASMLEPIYLASANFDRVMATLATRLESSEDPDERRELLSRLAKLYEEQKEDYAAALATVARLLDEDVTDQDTVRELERLARVADSGAALAQIYANALERISIDEPATARLPQRAAQFFAEHGKVEESLALYRRALEFDPDDRQVFEELDALLARAGKHEERVALYSSALENRFEDSERTALLHQMADLYRVALQRPEDAIGAHRAALEIEPNDVVSLDALSELYRELSRWSDLGDLYLSRAESSLVPSEAAGYRLQLARLRAAELGDPEGAIDQLEEVVREHPGHTAALDELEKLRKQGVARERIVGILLPLYESADDWRRLIKLNEDRFAMAEDVADKVAVLRETAELWERRGEDLDRARRGLAVAFELDPDDDGVRQDYERLVEATGAWDELCGVYQERLKVPELGSRRDLLAVLARVHDEKRNDPRRALAAYERLVEEDETNLDALEKLEQLATMLSDWDVLVRALRIKTELIDDPAERASLWRRVGETRRDMLEQPELAIEAYERAAEIEPDSTFTLDNLIGLYQERQDVPRLIELYQRRVELADDDEIDLKFELLCAAGSLYEAHQNDTVNAIDMFTQALGVKPSDKAVLGRVNRLYANAEMWPELLENLRFCVSIADADQERAELRTRIAEVLGQRLGEYDEALSNYRHVLDTQPGNQEVLAAVRTIGEQHAEFRELAASILIPALRSEARDEELVQAYEMRLSAQTDPDDRAETLYEMAGVLEKRLHRPADALSALLRSLSERPDSADLHADIERLARVSNGFKEYASALTERAQSTFDADLARFLYATLGRVAEQELGDTQAAIGAYEEAVRQAGDQPELLAALDRLYEKAGNYESLVEVLERRASVAGTEYEQADLYYRMATIQREQWNDSSRCLLSLRRALEYSPSHAGAIRELEKLLEDSEFFEEVSEILESVYRTLNDTGKLAALFERRIGLAASSEERLEARRTLARVLEEEVGDVAAAQRILQQGVTEEPSNLSTLEELARLAGITGEWRGAAEALEEALQKVAATEPATGREIALTLADWRRERLGDDAGAERALGVALSCTPDNDEILQRLEELQSAPGREQALIETLRRRGKLAEGEQREELFRRAKRVADTLREPRWAEEILRDLTRVDPNNDWALESLADLMEESGRYSEALGLIEQRIERGTALDLRELRHRAAVLAGERLQDPRKASEIYAALLEEDPSDTRASDALRVALVEAERWGDLARLLGTLIDVAESREERLALRLELANLYVERQQDDASAIEQLRLVLEEDPGNADAVLALGRLYEKNGRDEDLADLLSQQIDAARERGDTQGAIKLLGRLGEVYELRLNEPERAIEAYRRVLELERHRPSLEALVRLYRSADQWQDAAEILEQLLDGGDQAELARRAHELAEIYQRLENGEKACAALERVVEAGQAGPDTLQRLERLYERLGNWSRLAELVVKESELTQSGEEKAKLLSRAAALYTERLHDPQAATSLLQRATALRPDDRVLLLQLCDVLNASGRSREAAETLQRIVDSYGGRRSKELGEIHRRLAAAYRAQGNNAEAFKELDQAFRIEPGNVSILKELGELAFELDDLKKAQQMYRALLLQRLEGQSPITKAEVFYALGRVHDALGEKPKARQMLERALQTDANLEAAKRMLATLVD